MGKERRQRLNLSFETRYQNVSGKSSRRKQRAAQAADHRFLDIISGREEQGGEEEKKGIRANRENKFSCYFCYVDIDPRLDLSFFREGRCRCQAHRDMIRDNMEKEITINRNSCRAPGICMRCGSSRSSLRSSASRPCP